MIAIQSVHSIVIISSIIISIIIISIIIIATITSVKAGAGQGIGIYLVDSQGITNVRPAPES